MDGLGLWEVTVEPLDDGVYDILAEFEDSAGNLVQTEPLQIEIDTLEPNTPLLDLITSEDSGHSNADEITNVNRPLLSLTTHDPNAADHIIGENLKFRVYDRPGDGNSEVLIFDMKM